MQVYLKRDEVKVSIILLFYLLSMNTPYALGEITAIRSVFIVCRLLGVGILAFTCFKRSMRWNAFDIITLLFCVVIFISAFHAGYSDKIAANSIFAYLHSAYSRVIFILGQLLMIKLVFDLDEKTRYIMLKVIYWYYLVLCLINIVTQILGFEVASKSGNIFFLGLDNEMGKYYLFAFFYGCVLTALEEKGFHRRLFFLTLLTMIEGLYRRIGGLTAVSFLMAVLVLLFFWKPKLKIWNMRQDIILGSIAGCYMTIMILFTKLDILQVFINKYLFGKARSLTDRFALQTKLLAMWPESPLWGWASILSRIEWGDTTWFDYALSGGYTHNYIIETLYNYGIFAFLLYLMILLLGTKKINGYEPEVSFVGIAFWVVLVRGMFENGCQEVFAVLPTVYYLGIQYNNKYKSVRGKIQWQETQG